MISSIIGLTAFETLKLKDAIVLSDSGEWGQEPSEDCIGVLRSTNFTNQGRLTIDDIAFRTLTEDKRKEKLLEEKDIIIERSGGSNTQPVGRVGYIDKMISDRSFVFANFIQRIRLNNEMFNSKFVYYCLQQMYEMGITSSMQFQTTGIRNLDYKYYLKSSIPKPEINEQKAIADILTKIDEAIISVETSIAAAEKLKKSLMQNMLTGKLKPDGTWRSEDEFYVDDKFGKVPIGWECKPVGDKSLCNINPNYKFDKGYEFDFLPMDAVNDSFRGVSYMETKKIDGGGYTRFALGDILFAKITPCTENGKITLISDMNSRIGFASTEFIVFQPKETVNNQFFYYLLTSDRVHNLAVSLMEGTTGRQRVPWKIFKNRVIVSIPLDVNEQKLIAEQISNVEITVSNRRNKIYKLLKLKKSLMQKLLTGKIRINLDEINELLKED